MRLTALFAIAAAALAAAAAPPLQVVELGKDASTSGVDACGIWETTAGGSTLRLSRIPGARDAYSVAVIEASDYRLEPGTEVGVMTATATPRCYDAEFYTDPSSASGSFKSKKYHFIVEFDPSLRSCTFRAYRRGKRVSLRRMLPYLFRLAVIDGDNRPEGIDGAVRIDATPVPIIL